MTEGCHKGEQIRLGLGKPKLSRAILCFDVSKFDTCLCVCYFINPFFKRLNANICRRRSTAGLSNLWPCFLCPSRRSEADCSLCGKDDGDRGGALVRPFNPTRWQPNQLSEGSLSCCVSRFWMSALASLRSERCPKFRDAVATVWVYFWPSV